MTKPKALLNIQTLREHQREIIKTSSRGLRFWSSIDSRRYFFFILLSISKKKAKHKKKHWDGRENYLLAGIQHGWAELPSTKTVVENTWPCRDERKQRLDLRVATDYSLVLKKKKKLKLNLSRVKQKTSMKKRNSPFSVLPLSNEDGGSRLQVDQCLPSLTPSLAKFPSLRQADASSIGNNKTPVQANTKQACSSSFGGGASIGHGNDR